MSKPETSPFSDRAGGIAGFLFVAGVLVQNGLLLQGAPLPSAKLDVVLRFYVDHQNRIAIATGWVAVNVLLLVVFGAAATRRMIEDKSTAVWGRVGLGGVLLLAATFATTSWLQATLAARAADLGTAGQLSLVWDMHSAAFAMSGIALAVTLLGLSLGALQVSVVPRGIAILGLVGAFCLVVSGALSVSTIAGGPGVFFQLAGFVTWLAWLVTASWRLLRPA